MRSGGSRLKLTSQSSGPRVLADTIPDTSSPITANSDRTRDKNIASGSERNWSSCSVTHESSPPTPICIHSPWCDPYQFSSVTSVSRFTLRPRRRAPSFTGGNGAQLACRQECSAFLALSSQHGEMAITCIRYKTLVDCPDRPRRLDELINRCLCASREEVVIIHDDDASPWRYTMEKV